MVWAAFLGFIILFDFIYHNSTSIIHKLLLANAHKLINQFFDIPTTRTPLILWSFSRHRFRKSRTIYGFFDEAEQLVLGVSENTDLAHMRYPSSSSIQVRRSSSSIHPHSHSRYRSPSPLPSPSPLIIPSDLCSRHQSPFLYAYIITLIIATLTCSSFRFTQLSWHRHRSDTAAAASS